MNKRIAIVTLAVALEGEKGYSRFRTLAEMLAKDFTVDIITSTFQHWEKKQRNTDELLKKSETLMLNLLMNQDIKKCGFSTN